MFKEKYLEYNPKANPNNIIQGKNYRITLLTSKLVRLEYSKNNKFEDSRTKMVLNRYFDDVKYSLIEDDDNLKIITDDITIRYDKKEFSSYGLSVSLNEQKYHPYNCVYRYNESYENLGGTIRSLDFIDGEVDLDDGILSKNGISYVDDSNSPILTEDGWYKQRNSNDIDIYVFAYQREYLKALKDFYALTGKQPKLPRYALGNWWSRYHAYTDKEYLELMEKFKEEKIPFSVSVIDMDWHLPKWTSYTWNNKLFPNPKEFLKKLKSLNYAVSLNIHPLDGIRDFEQMYDEFAKDMGIENKRDIDFDYKSKKFFENTFKHLYYPNEKIGVDFWWLDWQQSPKNIDENKDALWVLNHYHFNDNRKNNKLGIVLSRYSGVGSHRYPIGFSGDVDITWESLNFQPYFTLTASNIGYGWYSHDIGGHRCGYKDEELQLRWLQFGVFSPINRLHSSNSSFLNKEPWNYKEPYCSLMKKYLKLRHELIPYIYTMNIIANEEDVPLIRPMYYYYPDIENSYEVKNQYFFGKDLLICPITTKINENTRKASFKTWFPKGNWYDYQTGLKYAGNRNLVINKDISEMGIFFKEGSIIPLAVLKEDVNDINNPEKLNIIIASGENGEFTLSEDLLGLELESKTCKTKIEYLEKENKIIIHPAIGNILAIPNKRSWIIRIYGKKIKKAIYKEKIEVIHDFNLSVSSFEIKDVSVKEKIVIDLINCEENFNELEFKINKIEEFLNVAYIKYEDKEKLYNICKSDKSINLIISEIISYNCIDEIKKVLIEILSA